MSESESVWQELLTTAQLGTERRPPALPPVAGALGGALAQLDRADPQRLLLNAAALTAPYLRAGRVPLRLALLAEPACAPDEQPRCSLVAGARLAQMLGGECQDFLPEWLGLAAAAGRRVPEELLPTLLSWAEKHSDQSAERVLPVLGQRGRWLAKQVPWCEAIGAAVFVEAIADEAVQTTWQTGRKALRHRLLRRLRHSHPALALDLLKTTWEEESAEERVAFLKLLPTGLSLGDEPFLEGLLDERAASVRLEAADLLSSLAGSRLVQRQLERAQRLLQWKAGGFLRKAQIEVTLPDVCGSEMVRDGVRPKPVGKAQGEKAYWLQQILSVIPPATWSNQWVQNPSRLLEIAGEGEWKELLHESWISAALSHADADWAEALLRLYPERGELLLALAPQRRFDFLKKLLKTQPDEGMKLLISYRQPWGAELTRLALPHLQATSTTLRFDLVGLARFMEPSLAAMVAGELMGRAEPGSAWERSVAAILQILDFRQQMREELQ
jgi:hypothetical protein